MYLPEAVQYFKTESAAFLASARIAANGGPITNVHLTGGGWGVFTKTGAEIEKAREILKFFNERGY